MNAEKQNYIAKEIKLKRLIAGIKDEQKVTWEELASACDMSKQNFHSRWNKGKVELWMYLVMVDYLRIPIEEIERAIS